MKIALFRNPTTGIEIVSGESSERYTDWTDLVRVSGFIDVEFPPLEPEAVMEKMNKFDAQMNKVTERYQRAIGELERQKAALTVCSRNLSAHNELERESGRRNGE